MKINTEHLKGAGFLVIAAFFMVLGIVLMRIPGEIVPDILPPRQEDLSRTDTGIGDRSQIGGMTVIGLDRSEENVLIVDVLPAYAMNESIWSDPMIMTAATLIAAAKLEDCRNQKALDFDISGEIDIRYRVFDADGISRREVEIEQGACTRIPVTYVPREDPMVLPFSYSKPL